MAGGDQKQGYGRSGYSTGPPPSEVQDAISRLFADSPQQALMGSSNYLPGYLSVANISKHRSVDEPPEPKPERPIDYPIRPPSQAQMESGDIEADIENRFRDRIEQEGLAKYFYF
jgi:hypothetical protein